MVAGFGCIVIGIYLLINNIIIYHINLLFRSRHSSRHSRGRSANSAFSSANHLFHPKESSKCRGMACLDQNCSDLNPPAPRYCTRNASQFWRPHGRMQCDWNILEYLQFHFVTLRSLLLGKPSEAARYLPHRDTWDIWVKECHSNETTATHCSSQTPNPWAAAFSHLFFPSKRIHAMALEALPNLVVEPIGAHWANLSPNSFNQCQMGVDTQAHRFWRNHLTGAAGNKLSIPVPRSNWFLYSNWLINEYYKLVNGSRWSTMTSTTIEVVKKSCINEPTTSKYASIGFPFPNVGLACWVASKQLRVVSGMGGGFGSTGARIKRFSSSSWMDPDLMRHEVVRSIRVYPFCMLFERFCFSTWVNKKWWSKMKRIQDLSKRKVL